MSQPQADAHDGSTTAFFDQLHTLLPRHEILETVRLTSRGVFVHERAADKLVELFREWLQQTTGSSEKRSLEKVQRRLYGEGPRTLYYVLDGKRCLPGYLLQATVTNRQSPIPSYSANLLDTREYLHPRDPFLDTLQGVRPRSTPSEGFVLELLSEKGSVDVPGAALEQFARVLRGSAQLAEKHGEALATLRGCIRPLQSLMMQARPVDAGRPLLVPERFHRQASAVFLRASSLIFVLEGKRLHYTYELKGKGLRRFLKEEAALIGADGGAPPVRGFEAGSDKPYYLGRIWQRGHSFHLHGRTASRFMKESTRAKKSRKKLPPRFTARELVNRITALFLSAKSIEERAIADALGPNREPFAKYRRAGEWVFTIKDKNVIESCLQLRKAAGDSDRTAAGAAHTPREATAAAPASSQARPPRRGGGSRRRRRRR